MDKVQAETILELKAAYDYAALRSAWKRLCAEYHPDKCEATGMDRAAANEVLKDINEAFNVLKPLVEDGSIVDPGNEAFSEAESQSALYEAAVVDFYRAVTAEDYDLLAERFRALGDYFDSASRAKMCSGLASHLRGSAAKRSEPLGTVSGYEKQGPSKSGNGCMVALYVCVVLLPALCAPVVAWSAWNAGETGFAAIWIVAAIAWLIGGYKLFFGDYLNS